VVPALTVESAEDLKKLLKQIGYTATAIDEILKWYRENNNNRSAS
jgi:hypothetical protein